MSKRNKMLKLPVRTGMGATSVKLPYGISAEVRLSDETGLISVTLSGFKSSLVIRERDQGMLQLRADWLPQVVKEARGDRVSAKTKDWSLAIRRGAAAMERHYQFRLDRGDVDAGGPVTLHRAIRAIRSNDLLPGTNDKVRKGYHLVLDLAEAVLREDPPLPLNEGHVRRIYDARVGKGASTEGSKAENNFEWPASFAHRRPLRPVSPRTAQKNLIDLQTALRTLMRKGGPGGGKLLDHEPFDETIVFEKLKAEARATFTFTRLQIVLGHVAEAEERMCTEGLRVVEIRKGKRKETLKSFRVVPGMLRMGLHHQFNHPTRPASWQAVSVDDIAFDSNGVTALIHSLKLSSDEPGFSPDAAEIWKHGAIVYRREHSKLKSERIVPLSEPFARELLRYLKARDQYLAELGIESDALYPCPRKPFRYIADNDMRHLLVKGDKVAREKITEAGENPDRWVPEYRGTKWYGYRRLWKTELNRLGWERTSASMYAGDWKPLGRNIADDVYARITPGMLLAVVERIPFSEAVAREQERSGHADVRDLRPIDLSELIDR